jgi:hypothetical protein
MSGMERASPDTSSITHTQKELPFGGTTTDIVNTPPVAISKTPYLSAISAHGTV